MKVNASKLFSAEGNAGEILTGAFHRRVTGWRSSVETLTSFASLRPFEVQQIYCLSLAKLVTQSPNIALSVPLSPVLLTLYDISVMSELITSKQCNSIYHHFMIYHFNLLISSDRKHLITVKKCRMNESVVMDNLLMFCCDLNRLN